MVIEEPAIDSCSDNVDLIKLFLKYYELGVNENA